MVEIVSSSEAMSKGLSGREYLAEGKGMLFVYPEKRYVIFWMPDMNFSIDIIYLSNNQVSQVEANVPNPPKDTPKEKLIRYPSKEKVDKVLEVPSGWAEKNNIKIGDQLKLE